jgi:hypothetical protein
MENVILINNLDRLKKIKSGFSRIYFGGEFCGRLLPSKQDIQKLGVFKKRSGINFSIVTPYIGQRGFFKLVNLLGHLNKEYPGLEIIVNDWGVLNLISERFNNLTMALGRVLSKQKRGFFVPLAHKDVPADIIKIKNREKEYLRSSILQNESLMKYIQGKGINRIGLDNLKQGVIVDKDAFDIDLYYPYVYLASSSYCLSASFANGVKLPVNTNKCGKICKKEKIRVLKICKENTYLSGNTQFYINNGLGGADTKKIDRLINVVL